MPRVDPGLMPVVVDLERGLRELGGRRVTDSPARDQASMEGTPLPRIEQVARDPDSGSVSAAVGRRPLPSVEYEFRHHHLPGVALETLLVVGLRRFATPPNDRVDGSGSAPGAGRRLETAGEAPDYRSPAVA